MPCLTFPRTAADGPIVEVGLLPSSRLLHALGRWALPPITLKMLIDTGADYTSVDAELIVPWRLRAGSAVKSQTFGGTVSGRMYDMSLSIRDGKGSLLTQFDPLPVVTRNHTLFDGLPFQGLLGRDVLDRGTFVYNGAGTHCMLAF